MHFRRLPQRRLDVFAARIATFALGVLLAVGVGAPGPAAARPAASGAQLPTLSTRSTQSAPPTSASPSGPLTGALTWTGDFETADLSQWGRPADALPGRLSLDSSIPGRQGTYAARVAINAGDPSPNSDQPDAQRAELLATQAQSQGFAGSDVWYGWSVYFPSPGFEAPNLNPNQAHPQTIFTQWKRTAGHCGSPNAFFEVNSAWRPSFFLAVQGGVNQTNDGTSSNCPGTVYNSYRLAQFTPGRWYDFVFHVKWSSDPAIGFVEVWINGVHVLARTSHATLYRDWNLAADYGVSLHQGEYRVFSPGNSSILYIDATRVGTSYAAVAPQRSAGS